MTKRFCGFRPAIEYKGKMIVLLLLGAFVYMGLSDSVVEKYGATHVMDLSAQTHSIEFKPLGSFATTVVWKRDDPSVPRDDASQQVAKSSLIISHLKQRDSGLYVMRDKDGHELSRMNMEVKENRESYEMAPGDTLSFSFDLEQKSCNIYFNQQNGNETKIVHRGRLQQGLEHTNCSELDLVKPCGILIKELHVGCRGSFEIIDSHGDKALVVDLRITDSETTAEKIYQAVCLTALAVGLMSWCYTRLCRRTRSEAWVDQAVTLMEFRQRYDNQPSGPGQEQPSQLLMPSGAVPSYTRSDPLVHNPPTVNAANAEAPAPPPADAASVLSLRDNEPRFELKGMDFPLSSPLSSDSSYQDVYTSDKLSFK